jgi:hypothetical protein
LDESSFLHGCRRIQGAGLARILAATASPWQGHGHCRPACVLKESRSRRYQLSDFAISQYELSQLNPAIEKMSTFPQPDHGMIFRIA